MAELLYNLFIGILGTVIKALSWWHPKARKFVEGRKNVLSSLSAFREQFTGEVLWMHVSSLGEFEQGRPLLEAWKKEFPDYGIFLTFFSPSGFEVRKDYPIPDCITYLPIDTPANARQFIETLKPKIAIFVKYDFWYNYLHRCVDLGIRVVFISALFRPEQVYFNRGQHLFLPLFRKFDHFFVQNESSKALLQKHGVDRVSNSGDTRLDRVVKIKTTSFEHALIEQFAADRPVIVFGSIWYSDVNFLGSELPRLRGNYRFIFAPHHIDQKSLDQFYQINPQGTVFLSQVREEIPSQIHTLIVDEIGSLSKIYRFARYAYIGGALHAGLHNTLEAAVYGLPVFFAHHPNNHKFEEAKGMEESGAAFGLKQAEQMTEIIQQMDADDAAYQAAAGAAHAYVHQHAGATDLIMDHLKPWA